MLPVPDCLSTPRLTLRRWHPHDAERFKDAIDTSLTRLQEWMPWAMDEPTPIDAIRFRLRLYEAEFDCGHQWLLGIFTSDESQLLGGIGLHPLSGPRALDIGYWLKTGKTGFGYATEAARELTRMALALPGIDRIEIRCDPRNLRSVAVPRRLGYEHVATFEGDPYTPAGDPRETMVWRLSKGGG